MRKFLFVSRLRRIWRTILPYSTRYWRRRVGRPSPPLRAKVPVRHLIHLFIASYESIFLILQHNDQHDLRQTHRRLVSWTKISRPNYSMKLTRPPMVTAARPLMYACVRTAHSKTRTAEMIATCADYHCKSLKESFTQERKRVSICEKSFIECCRCKTLLISAIVWQ